MFLKNLILAVAKLTLITCAVSTSFAQINKTHEWIASPPKGEAQARITNLSNGETVESPFVVKFGINLWGIAPAGQNYSFTGHHHLLINTPLPLDIQAPIPFSDNYRHFGKGQMEAILDLPPGQHTLQLLLADHKHVPFFVYSNPIKITVARKNPNAIPLDYGKKPKLEILNLKDGDERNELLQVVFHASGLNIAPEASKVDPSGYFRLAIQHEKKGSIERISFPEGQTETWLKLPKGKVRIQLEFITSPNKAVHEAKSEWLRLTIR